LVIAAEMSSESDRERIVRETTEHHGRVDVLVDNAGIGEGVAVEDETTDQFRLAIGVKVTAVWHMAKLCSPSMISSGRGSIVNIASFLGFVGSIPMKHSHHCASKGAVVNLTRELALQWARKGVRVNTRSARSRDGVNELPAQSSLRTRPTCDGNRCPEPSLATLN